MAANTLAIKDKVQRYLIDIMGSARVDRDGDFVVASGSSTCFVSVKEWGDDSTVVRIFALTNREVPGSPGLFEFIASSSYFFGNLFCKKKDDTFTVYFAHSLLGEFLDPDEFRTALLMVGRTSDELDDQIKAKFGGKLFGET